MCGRLNIHDSRGIQELMEDLGLPIFPGRSPRYNITPTSDLDVLTLHGMSVMQWGIEFGKFRHPNSKSDTIQRKPHLQNMLRDQRCIVPVNRFYEWPDPKIRPKYQGVKTRFCIHTPEDVMFLAGIYRIQPSGVMQCNIITTDPNSIIADFHHRMPVIIAPTEVNTWLQATQLSNLYAMMVPYNPALIVYECNAYVDNGRNVGPQCMAEMK